MELFVRIEQRKSYHYYYVFLMWFSVSSVLLALKLSYNSGLFFFHILLTFSFVFYQCVKFSIVNRAILSFINNNIVFIILINSFKLNVLKSETAICRQAIELSIIQIFFWIATTTITCAKELKKKKKKSHLSLQNDAVLRIIQ